MGSVCFENSPTVDYGVDVTEGDDPVGTITLFVVDAADTILIEEAVTGDAADSLLLPGRDGDAVTVRWDFDDTTAELTLADNCAEVLGVVQERAPDPAPEPVVESEQLPAAGATSDLILALGGFLLALGCSLLLLERRTRYVRV